MNYSIIVPVYNRPDEVDELLQSLCQQSLKDFEVIIVEDGSQKTCKDVCEKYADILDLHYYYKENSGPGQSRNYGAERARGEWLIILDSDVVLPEGYLQAVDEGIRKRKESDLSAFGGPDTAHPDFTPVQKAISYSMTSFFTTGGIRGGKAGKTEASENAEEKRKALDKFYPRSYNMGIRRETYLALGGFSKMRFGEDIDFSYRIIEAGYKTTLFPEAWVWHKRRTDFRKFFRQVYNSGIARINLEKRHPGTLKLVHLLPTVFTVGTLLLLTIAVIGILLALLGFLTVSKPGCNPSPIVIVSGLALTALSLLPLLLYSLIICIDSSLKNKSAYVGLLSVPAAFVQLMGYGLGFIESWWKRCVLKQDEFTLSEHTEAERTDFEKKFYQ